MSNLSTMADVISYFPSDFSTFITAPFLLQLKLTSGAPLALHESTPVLPLSEADLAMEGDVSMIGLSEEIGSNYENIFKLAMPTFCTLITYYLLYLYYVLPITFCTLITYYHLYPYYLLQFVPIFHITYCPYYNFCT